MNQEKFLPDFIQRLDKLGYEISEFTKYLKGLDNKPNKNSIIPQEVLDFKSAPNFTRSTRFENAIGQDVIKVNDTLGVSPYDQSVAIQWGGYGTGSFGIKSSTDGKQNTLDILDSCSFRPIAASICSDFGDGDWYLPAINQLETLYKNKDSINNVADMDFFSMYYWSSTGFSNCSSAYDVLFCGGGVDTSKKDTLGRVRCVRSFI